MKRGTSALPLNENSAARVRREWAAVGGRRRRLGLVIPWRSHGLTDSHQSFTTSTFKGNVLKTRWSVFMSRLRRGSAT
ncbi:hypothetical protein E2C01_084419 [Portunus trituberculatus]|uniref:Uncharacterized protein n=1 Tax=Portunus trituberculatus TaxID=210409 RepID=A0A5B7J966_PORTR|nr:hypothetical protein [Portunus trituberculatus]